MSASYLTMFPLRSVKPSAFLKKAKFFIAFFSKLLFVKALCSLHTNLRVSFFPVKAHEIISDMVKSVELQ